jgi:hypothetical protein
MPRLCPVCQYPNPDGRDTCFQCDSDLIPPPPLDPPAPPDPPLVLPPAPLPPGAGTSAIAVLGALLLIAGCMTTLGFAFDYDTAVEINGYGSKIEILNLGLLMNRLIGVICGIAAAFAALLLLITDGVINYLKTQSAD